MKEPEFAAICARQPRAAEARYEKKNVTRSWTIGVKKAFAVWHFGEEQPGPHVRSNDAKVHADVRVKRSRIDGKYMEKTNNFLWLDMSKAWAPSEIEALVAASAALATRKDGGVKRGGELGDLYIVVRKALQAVPVAMWPAPPHHAGGPAAKFFGTEGEFAGALGKWLEKLVDDVVPNGPEETKRMKSARARVSNAQYGWMGASGDCAVAAAELLAVLAGRGEAERVRALIAEIDDRVMIGELQGAVKKHAQQHARGFACERVLWRGADVTGNPGRWIARISPGRYALLAKLGPRWQWVEGARDDVLSSVPDADFEVATKIVLQRE